MIGQKGTIAVRLIVEAVNRGMEPTLDKGLGLDEEQWRKCGVTGYFNTAIKAIMEKKPVVFRGW